MSFKLVFGIVEYCVQLVVHDVLDLANFVSWKMFHKIPPNKMSVGVGLVVLNLSRVRRSPTNAIG